MIWDHFKIWNLSWGLGYVNMTNLNYKICVQDDYTILDMWSRWSRDGGSVNKMYMGCHIHDWDVPKIQDLLTRWFWDSWNVIGMNLRCKIINEMTLRCQIYYRDEFGMSDLLPRWIWDVIFINKMNLGCRTCWRDDYVTWD